MQSLREILQRSLNIKINKLVVFSSMNNLKPKTVALIIPDFDYGGEEKRVVYFANNYTKHFEKVLLFAPAGKSTELLEKKVKHIKVNTKKKINIITVLRLLKRYNVDCLQGHKRAILPYLFLAEKLLGIKVFFNFDNIYLNYNGLLSFISPKRIVYLSDVLKDFYAKYYQSHYNTTINMGGDFFNTYDINERNESRAQLGVADKFTILSLGRLAEQKNHKLLIDALHLLQNESFVCLIAGTGPLQSELKLHVQQYGISDRVYFLGHRTDIEALLNASDVLVQSSLFEGFPNVFIEAASVGLPLISTNVGSARTLVMDNGILLKNQTPETLAEAIKKTIQELDGFKDSANQMKQSEYFRQFSKKNMLNNYVHYIENM
jgi:glycosyltransferase involved in cell wall biosynthesis